MLGPWPYPFRPPKVPSRVIQSQRRAEGRKTPKKAEAGIQWRRICAPSPGFSRSLQAHWHGFLFIQSFFSLLPPPPLTWCKGASAPTAPRRLVPGRPCDTGLTSMGGGERMSRVSLCARLSAEGARTNHPPPTTTAFTTKRKEKKMRGGRRDFQ